MSYYAKRFNLKTEITTIEGTYEKEEEAVKKTEELLKEEEELEYTTCIFAVEDKIEDELSYNDIIKAIFIETCEEAGIPAPEFTIDYLENFKKLL